MTGGKPDNLEANSSLSHYRILKKLGAGGMGEVFLAADSRLRRKVALKVLPPDISEDKNRLGRFEQEAFAASALNHPNILTVYEFGSENGVYFLATELVEGETLRAKIAGGEMSLRDALNIAEQIAFALTAAHEAGIVHRDIKPENIMIRRDRIVKVLDFGIAKLVAPSTDSSNSEVETLAKFKTQTKEGTIIGTLQYMSPEQLRGQTVDARSDIFSLGSVIYEMLTGKAPFNKPTTGDVIAAILTENPPSVTETGIEAPAELQRIIGKALKKNRDERYQNSKDLLLDIKSLEREIEFPTYPRAAATGGEARLTESRDIHTTSPAISTRFSAFNIIAVLLVAALAIGGIWWFAGKNDSQTDSARTFMPNVVEAASWKSSPGEIYNSGSFSPDGKIIAFTSTQTGAKNIWIKQLSGGDAVQITKDESLNQNPIWSPGGDEIAFFSDRSGSAGVWRVSSFGGSPIFIKALDDGGAVLRRWSKKGLIYYESEQNLFSLDVKSGQSSQITDLDAKKVNPNTISLSPDEEQIAYIAFENDQYSIWTMPLNGGAPKQIHSQPEEIRNAVWCADNKRILYSTITNGIFQLFAADASGSKTQITFGERDAFALDVSAEGAKILYGASKEESDMWGASVEKGEEFPVASDIASELWANVSFDGKTIAYQSIRNLSQGDKIFNGAILTKPLDREAQAFQLVADAFLPGFSPDNQQIAFMRVADEKFNLWTVRASGGEEKQLTPNRMPSVEHTILPYNRTQTSIFSWSPDGKMIAYVSNVEKKRNVWLVNADGSNNTQLTNNDDSNLHVNSPLWSPDGKRLAYSARTNNPIDKKRFFSVLVIDLQTKTPKTVIQTETFQRLLGWSASGKELFLAALGGKFESSAASPTEVSIVQVDAETGEQRQLAKLDSTYLYNICLSADKKMLGYVSKKDGRDNVWTIRLNGGESRKITSNNDPKLYFSSIAWSPDNRAVYFGKQTRYSMLSLISNFK